MDSLLGGFVRLMIWIAGFVAIVCAILYFKFVRIVAISEDNMAPTVLAGERVVLWRDAELGLSDIAVCQHPHQPHFVVGRVVARAGMTITTDKLGTYFVNGARPDVHSEGVIDFLDQRSGHRVPMQWGHVAYGGHEHLFMAKPGSVLRITARTLRTGVYLLNDNRSYLGSDSRSFGEVDPATCLGQVFFRLTPAHPARDDIEHGWLQIVR